MHPIPTTVLIGFLCCFTLSFATSAWTSSTNFEPAPSTSKSITSFSAKHRSSHRIVKKGKLSKKAGKWGLIKCESKHFKLGECRLSGRILYAGKIRQHSKSKCVRNKTFFVSKYVIRVTAGCRATFYYSLVPYYPLPQKVLSCSSIHFKKKFCYTGLPVAYVQLVRRYSRSQCKIGKSYGASDYSVVVQKGCRGLFAVYV